jgi:hypothetical protein
MDFKLLIILLGLLLLIIYLAKSILDIKSGLLKVESNLDGNLKNVKSRINLLSTEIKTYNNDLIVSAKKMNKINSQQITSMSNYYTESESDGNKNIIEYLSDVKNKSDFKINFNTQEEENKKTIDEEHEEQQDKEQQDKEQQDKEQQDKEQQEQQPEIIEIDVNPLNIISDDESVNSKSNKSVNSKSNKSVNSKSNKSVNSSKSSIKLENITIGSTATGKGKKININTNDSESDVDKEITTLDDLKNISSYSKLDLESIAKSFSLPLTYIDSSQNRKIYKKEELYNSIKDYLVKNKK